VQSLDPEYVVGLVDGEGSFTVYVRDPSRTKTATRRVMVEPKFYLKLIERDVEILYKLQQFFGCGQVYFQKDTRKNHQNCYRFEVFRRDDLTNTIIPFFTKHSPKIASKQHDFNVFCKMMELIHADKHRTTSGLRTLLSLKQQMH
jgi:hypothetical protein